MRKLLLQFAAAAMTLFAVGDLSYSAAPPRTHPQPRAARPPMPRLPPPPRRVTGPPKRPQAPGNPKPRGGAPGNLLPGDYPRGPSRNTPAPQTGVRAKLGPDGKLTVTGTDKPDDI